MERGGIKESEISKIFMHVLSNQNKWLVSIGAYWHCGIEKIKTRFRSRSNMFFCLLA